MLSFASCTKDNSNDITQSNTSNNSSPETPTAPLKLYTPIGQMSAFATESSGVEMIDGFIYTFNDSGNSNKFYKVNPTDATLVQTITVSNFPDRDWEDITSDDDYIYLSDTGNNHGTRKDLKVLKIAKSQLNSTEKTITVTAEAISYSYSEQTKFEDSSTHNFDCETLISIEDSLYLFTKDRGDNNTNVYKLSKSPGVYVLTQYDTYTVNGLLTGGDYNPDTKEIVLIGYASGYKNSFLYHLTDFEGDSFFSGKVTREIIGNYKDSWQTEGITYGDTEGETFYLSCETNDFIKATLYKTSKELLGW